MMTMSSANAEDDFPSHYQNIYKYIWARWSSEPIRVKLVGDLRGGLAPGLRHEGVDEEEAEDADSAVQEEGKPPATLSLEQVDIST